MELYALNGFAYVKEPAVLTLLETKNKPKEGQLKELRHEGVEEGLLVPIYGFPLLFLVWLLELP